MRSIQSLRPRYRYLSHFTLHFLGEDLAKNFARLFANDWPTDRLVTPQLSPFFTPPDIVIVCRRTYVLPGILLLLSSSFTFRQLPAELAERNSTISSHMTEVSVIWKCISEMWGIPSPHKSATKNHLFPRFRNLKTNLTAYIFETKHDVHKRASALQTTRGLLHCLEMTWTLVHKRLQIGSQFLSTLQKFCIPLHYQASQMEISKRNSTKLWMVNHANNLP